MWGQYATAADPTLPCDPTRPVLVFSDCIHLGERREVFVPNLGCDGLVVTDELDAFDWRCEANDDGALLISSGLRRGRGLRDLIAGDAWRPNRVRIQRDGVATPVTDPSAWWDSAIVPLPDNAAGDSVVALDQAGAVYTLSTRRATAGYEITADGVSVVALDGAALVSEDGRPTNCTIAGEGAQFCVVRAQGRHGLWIELGHDVVGLPYSFVVALDDVAMSVVREVRDDGRDVFADVWVGNSRGNRISNITTRRTVYGVMLVDSTGNLVEHLAQSNSFAGTLKLERSSNNTVREIEANHDDGSSIELIDAVANRLSELRLARFEGCGLDLDRARDNLVIGFQSLDGDGPAVCSRDSTGNTFAAFTIAGNGFQLANSAANTIVDGVILGSRDDDPIRLTASPANIVGFVTIVNSALAGVVIEASSDGVVLDDVVIANITGVGLQIRSSANVRVHDLAVANTGPQIELTTADNSSFHGGLALGPGNGCVVTGNTPGVDATCAPANASTASPRSIDLSASVIGPISEDDANNPLDALGLGMPDYLTPMFPISSFPEIFAFANRYRQWGLDATFPSAQARGRCRDVVTTTPCRIWDLRLRAGDTVLARRAGDGSVLPMPTAGEACPAYLAGDVTVDDPRVVGGVFLRHAIEDLGDELGDDDGLCESNEACTAAPNLGSYQGEGALATCTFAAGAVSGVTLRFHAQPTAP